MHHRLLFTLLISLTTVLYAADGADAPTLPAGMIKISTPGWKNSAEVEVRSVPGFRGSIRKELGDSLGSVKRTELLGWQFVGKSDFGEVYVFAFLKPNGEKDVVSAVVDSSKGVVLEREGIRVEISIARKKSAGLVRIEDLDRPVKAISQPLVRGSQVWQPPQSSGRTAEAIISFTVQEDGSVVDVSVVRATTPEVGTAALEAVKKWRFESATSHGAPARFQMKVPIVATL